MISRSVSTILPLIASNSFMNSAWYGHLRFKDLSFIKHTTLFGMVLVSWGIALFEYLLMVPANRFDSNINGGPFNMW